MMNVDNLKMYMANTRNDDKYDRREEYKEHDQDSPSIHEDDEAQIEQHYTSHQ